MKVQIELTAGHADEDFDQAVNAICTAILGAAENRPENIPGRDYLDLLVHIVVKTALATGMPASHLGEIIEEAVRQHAEDAKSTAPEPDASEVVH